MRRITNITIKKFKGIDERNLDFTDLYANKLNLLVAPNGFGKSSLANCFDNLIQGKLKLPEDLRYIDSTGSDQQLSLTINFDGSIKTFIADQTKNEISKNFEIVVINSKVTSVTKQGFQFTKATSRIEHEKLMLVDKVPLNKKYPYKKSTFSVPLKASKVPVTDLNVVIFSNPSLILWLLFLEARDRLKQVRPKQHFNLIEAEIKKGLGVLNEAVILNEINSVDLFKEIHEKLVLEIKPSNNLEGYVILYQLLHLFFNDYDAFMDAIEYELYKSWKDRVKGTIKLLNSAKFEVAKLVETKGALIFSLENFDKLSNGQRDVASFIAQLFKAEYQLLNSSNKDNSILIIDEVFDYLDDANIVSCQYFISKLIDSFKSFSKNIFPLVLTHLAPAGFDSFKTHKMKCHFLQSRSALTRDSDLRKLITSRSDRGVTKADRDIISQYYMHYSSTPTLSLPVIGLSSAITGSQSVHDLVKKHLIEYLKKTTKFDPFAICVALRIEFERHIYSKITDGLIRARFMGALGTSEKLTLAEANGIDVPEVFYLLGIIYNEALHTHDYQISFSESKIASQLENEVISILITEAAKICGIP